MRKALAQLLLKIGCILDPDIDLDKTDKKKGAK